ncbi:MAG TPA: alkaline phosphatase family protein [Thermoanaerobaculia bacterium]|jgi:predicted AlkP superfamily pyrophosphatase or phosphodiesterase
MIRTLRPTALAAVCLLALAAIAGAAPVRPRLVVLISIDQFRADYQTRFYDLYLPSESKGGVGGFRWLMERGAYHTDAHHDHYPLLTGPGHSIHFTGAPPYKTGIVGNDWFDRDLNEERYCVRDTKSPLVGAPDPDGKRGVSAITLRVSTVGDELKMATGGHAKVWGLALKDRAAVLMAGHLADGVLWYDDQTGAWISSRYYRKDGTLPKWVSDWNGQKKIDAFFGKYWTLSVPASALDRLWTPDNKFASDPSKLGKSFGPNGHKIDGGLTQPGPVFYKAFTYTPYANDYVLDTARELIRQEKLGQDETPDILALNLSTNDYIGHAYGPDSAEVLDVTVQTDRQLSRFFQFLNKAVPGGLQSVTVVLTADHGVAPIAEAAREAGFTAGLYDEKALAEAAEKALDEALGAGDWSKSLSEANFYLNLDELKAKRIAPERAEEIAAAALRAQPGIYNAYTRSQILGGRMLDNDVAQRVARSFHPKVSGDVLIVPEPFWVPDYAATGATHGTPYAYDTSVPLLLAGKGIKPGRYTRRVSTLDIASTLSDLLGVLQPSGCEGRVLSEALK